MCLFQKISAHEEYDPMPPPLPNKLESLPLLDAISRSQGFPVGEIFNEIF